MIHITEDDRSAVKRMALNGTVAVKRVGSTVPILLRTTATPHSVMTIEVIDYIKPTIDSAIAAKTMVQLWRNAAQASLADAWQMELSKSFTSGPSRWTPLSPRYAAWKSGRRTSWNAKNTRQRYDSAGTRTTGVPINTTLAGALYGTQSYAASAQANLILRTNLVQNVMNAREHVYMSKVGPPMITIDIGRQFESTSYVWLHEYGYKRIPMRDFIRRARKEVTGIMAGLTVSEFAVISRGMAGDAVVEPEITRATTARGMPAVQAPLVIRKPPKFSWGWLGRWFSKPWWWLAPPSKAYLYLGIYSDLKTILTQGIDPATMVIPFMGAWGVGYSGAMIGVPLTKKTTRRRARRTMWQRK